MSIKIKNLNSNSLKKKMSILDRKHRTNLQKMEWTRRKCKNWIRNDTK